jgi:hypothetical protein
VTRHKWSAAQRTYGSNRSVCIRCGMMKDARFCYGTHWTEYKEPGGEWFTPASTPPCPGVRGPGTEHMALSSTDRETR